MTSDHLGDIPAHGTLLPPGHGFGLGFAVYEEESPLGPSRRLSWYGIASTMFWIDLEQELIGIYLVMMLSHLVLLIVKG